MIYGPPCYAGVNPSKLAILGAEMECTCNYLGTLESRSGRSVSPYPRRTHDDQLEGAKYGEADDEEKDHGEQDNDGSGGEIWRGRTVHTNHVPSSG